MAVEATITTLYDGATQATIQVIGKHDGQYGQENNVVKVDVSELIPAPKSVRIDALDYDVNGGVVTLLWDDSLGPIPFLYLKDQGKFCYHTNGGLQNTADVDSRSGDILLSTTDFEQNGTYSITLKVRKKW
jgi:hypothetical protein